MKRNTRMATLLCLAVFGSTLAAGGECQFLRGSITETSIPAPNDPMGRVVGVVEGVLNGASSAVITGFAQAPAPFIVLRASSFDVFVTKRGDVLMGTGAVVLTPIPDQPPGEFTMTLTVTVTGGSGRFDSATGQLVFEGVAHHVFSGGVFNLTYQGSVCGPNVKAADDGAAEPK